MPSQKHTNTKKCVYVITLNNSNNNRNNNRNNTDNNRKNNCNNVGWNIDSPMNISNWRFDNTEWRGFVIHTICTTECMFTTC